jgi:hypothetical protein
MRKLTDSYVVEALLWYFIQVFNLAYDFVWTWYPLLDLTKVNNDDF